LTTGEQVMVGLRDALTARGILDSAGVTACRHGQRLRTAGLLVVHQSPPTAKGFHFLTLEDEKGMINVVVRPKIFARYREVIRGYKLLLVDGVCEQAEGVTNVLAVAVRPVMA
jgi:error-prone DNA polymerase